MKKNSGSTNYRHYKFSFAYENNLSVFILFRCSAVLWEEHMYFEAALYHTNL